MNLIKILNLYEELISNFIFHVLQVGFVLNDNTSFIGPLVIFPRTVFCWNIASGEDINEESLSLFFTIEPKLDLLVLGLEKQYERKRIIELRKILIREGINTEICPVGQACGIYNLVCDEGRFVAAALIPPLVDNLSRIKKDVEQMALDEK